MQASGKKNSLTISCAPVRAIVRSGITLKRTRHGLASLTDPMSGHGKARLNRSCCSIGCSRTTLRLLSPPFPTGIIDPGYNRSPGAYGLGPGVGRVLGVGPDRGVGVGLGVAVGVALGVVVAVAVGVAVGVAVAVGVGVGPP